MVDWWKEMDVVIELRKEYERRPSDRKRLRCVEIEPNTNEFLSNPPRYRTVYFMMHL